MCWAMVGDPSLVSTLYHLLYSHELGGNKYRSILSISPQQLKPYYPQMNLKISIVSIMNICIRYHLFDVTSIVKLQVVFTSLKHYAAGGSPTGDHRTLAPYRLRY